MQPLQAYTDYRQFLRDWFAAQKARNPRYSHRLFAQKAGLTSTGFFSEVLNGKRLLAPAAVLKFCKALKLTGADKAFFENLVAFNQAKGIEERNHHFGKLQAPLAKGGARTGVVGQDRYAFYRDWMHAAVRELVACRPTRARTPADFAQLGQALEPPVSAAKAKASVALLLRLGFLVRRPDGLLAQAEPLVSTGDLAAAAAAGAPAPLDVDNFQAAMLALARKAMDRQPRARRDFSTLTLSLSAAGATAARAEVAALRQRLLALAEKDASPDRVRQFNFQAFDLSTPPAAE